MTDEITLLRCPFCGCAMTLSTVTRDWWRISGDHDEDCFLCGQRHDAPQTDDQKQLLIEAWNRRAAVEADRARPDVSARHPDIHDNNSVQAKPADHAGDADKMVPSDAEIVAHLRDAGVIQDDLVITPHEMNMARIVIARWGQRAASAEPVTIHSEDLVAVPRDLLGAACSAIDKKRDGQNVLTELRRYTIGDLSAPVAQLPESMSRDEMLAYYSQYANVQASEALQYQKRIRDLEVQLAASVAQEPVAYLDVGADGYLDLGSDKGDDELSKLPKGRHMLAIIGTYGANGYVSAQVKPDIVELAREGMEVHAGIPNSPEYRVCAELVRVAEAAAPVAAQPIVTDEMVTRFLGWHLPQDFAPDAGISFTPSSDPHSWPVGTNLLTDPQARAMLEYVLQGAPAAAQAQPDDAPYPFLPDGWIIHHDPKHGYMAQNRSRMGRGDWLPTRQAATACAWAMFSAQPSAQDREDAESILLGTILSDWHNRGETGDVDGGWLQECVIRSGLATTGDEGYVLTQRAMELIGMAYTARKEQP